MKYSKIIYILAIVVVSIYIPDVCISFASNSKATEIEDLIDNLDSEDSLTRAVSTEALGKLRDEGSVDALLNLVDDPSAKVRLFAIQSLGQIGHKDVASKLIQSLQDPNASIRAITAWSLGRLESPVATNALIKSLNDLDKKVREHSAEALGLIGDIRAKQPLFKLLSDKSRINDRIITRVSSALRSIAINNTDGCKLTQAYVQTETAWEILKICNSPRAVSDFWYGIWDIEQNIQERRKFKELEKLYLKYIENPPPPQERIYFELGRCYDWWGLRDYDEAVKYYQECIKINPKSDFAQEAEKFISLIEENQHTLKYAVGILKLETLVDKQEYIEGDTIWVSVRLTNLSDTTVRVSKLKYRGACEGMDITVTCHAEDIHGNEVWPPPAKYSIYGIPKRVSEQLPPKTSITHQKVSLPAIHISLTTIEDSIIIICKYHSSGDGQDYWQGTLFAESELIRIRQDNRK